ncbi:hypothetical protein BJ878DRAFT_124627 [Calycina marina]|uniref:Uncharacterized protein n=1 Tax=Calycina marina TaxID=1763456 RepID=A0A9P7Z135_9HELO|nr:hypothetical protein BJ878DRAFT_124627 [Calycina marina]
MHVKQMRNNLPTLHHPLTLVSSLVKSPSYEVLGDKIKRSGYKSGNERVDSDSTEMTPLLTNKSAVSSARNMRIFHLFFLLYLVTLVTAQLLPSNSEHATRPVYPGGCEIVSGNKTTHYITVGHKQYCTTVGSKCSTTQNCRSIAQNKPTRLYASNQGAKFA